MSPLPFDTLVLCTHNQGKLREMRTLLAPLGITLRAPEDFEAFPEPEETGETFVANARIKSQAAFAYTGLPSLSDDSGLVVEALDGAPGVHSARYAGVEGPERDQRNRDKLRAAIADVPTDRRQAHFRCEMVLTWGESQEQVFSGRCDGVILAEERGEGGFGYDPLFWLAEEGKSFAEMDASMKHQYSHRGRALQQFLVWLGQKVDAAVG